MFMEIKHLLLAKVLLLQVFGEVLLAFGHYRFRCFLRKMIIIVGKLSNKLQVRFKDRANIIKEKKDDKNNNYRCNGFSRKS